MSNPWLLLLLAIAAEVVGTSCLKLSEGLSRPWPTLVVLAAYGTAMLLLARVVQTLPLGLSYALWSGIGIVAITLVGVLAYRQLPSGGELLGIGLIAAGVVLVNLSGKAHG
ncbi:DMT family transporter [Vulcanococcus limneticus]|uniref:DMT family transporter n=1 Tax=Vulcanococcus limneticus TaxID=2170428 RepID=UPI00398BCCD2